jgi:putative mRNA 3-end processing factor
MKLTFYGAAKEVGRSCIVVNDKYMLDAGLELNSEIRYPLIKDLSTIKAIFLCHAHLDHTGALPLFNFQGLRCPVFCTSMTKKITHLLLKDEYKIQTLQREHPAYQEFNITNVLASMTFISPKLKRTFEDMEYCYYSSGHIPGSCSIFMDIAGRTLLYTSDINCIDTQLMKKCDEMPHAEIMICESTYGDREHPDRKEEEEKFLSKVSETIERGGSVLIPVFAVGRAQEIMMILERLDKKVPIYLDGMAKEVTEIVLEEPVWVRNPQQLRKAFSNVKLVNFQNKRQEIVKQQSIVITTSGMMEGGPVIDYLKHMHFDDKSSILMTGYQAVDCNGRRLLETGHIELDGALVKVKCEYAQFDFSAHAGRKELVQLIKKVNPDVLILQHGDINSIKSLASEFKDKKVYIPELGESIIV